MSSSWIITNIDKPLNVSEKAVRPTDCMSQAWFQNSSMASPSN